MEIRIEHTTDYPWDLLLLADPNRELVDSYLKTSDCFAAFSGDKPVAEGNGGNGRGDELGSRRVFPAEGDRPPPASFCLG